MCVGAVDSTYAKASFSNHGEDIDYLAPGTDVVSLDSSSDFDAAQMSGCSMASPHVAGMAAGFVSVSLAIHSLMLIESVNLLLLFDA